VTIEVDPQSGMPATPMCPQARAEVYIAGTQPVGVCPLHGGRPGVTNVAGWDNSAPRAVEPMPAPPHIIGGVQPGTMAQRQAPVVEAPAPPGQKPPEKPPEKKGFFRRLWGVFK